MATVPFTGVIVLGYPVNTALGTAYAKTSVASFGLEQLAERLESRLVVRVLAPTMCRSMLVRECSYGESREVMLSIPRRRWSTHNLELFLDRMLKGQLYSQVARHAQMGVDALKHATPIDSGNTADHWSYEIEEKVRQLHHLVHQHESD